jgi:hypothetical protein
VHVLFPESNLQCEGEKGRYHNVQDLVVAVKLFDWSNPIIRPKNPIKESPKISVSPQEETCSSAVLESERLSRPRLFMYISRDRRENITQVSCLSGGTL